jgi:hypothetical protein
MTLEDLGSIGEFVAAVATVVTLVYLALQIRYNTKAIELTARRGVQEDASRWRQNLIQHPEVAELYRKGIRNPESLERSERLRFRMLLDDLFDHWAFQNESAMGEFREANRRDLAAVMATPGGAAHWAAQKARFSAEFIAYVESLDTHRPHNT